MLSAPRDRDLPLSFAQERLWFIDQLAPGTTAYNMPVALRIQGPLRIDALEQALTEIVRRHESLRTHFAARMGKPIQVIMDPAPVWLSPQSMEGFEPAAILRQVSQAAHEPFDLQTGPLFRQTLYRLGPEDHVLILVMHHIVSDGWSLGILTRELTLLYEAFSKNAKPGLPALPLQYADFACWQRHWLQGEALDRQIRYWREQLDGLVPLELPTVFPRPAVATLRGGTYVCVLPPDLAESLRLISRREGATLFMTLLAGFYTLLHRYTGQDDLIIGSPIANRNRGEIEGLIGFFVNMLALRVNVEGNPSFTDVLHLARQTALGGYEHQDVPFEKVVDEIAPERDLSRNPLFQVAFALQNAPSGAFDLAGARVTPQGFESWTTRLDLELHVWEMPEGLGCLFTYSTDLFDAEYIARMAVHWRRILEQAAADPGWPVGQIPMLDDAEQRTLVETWNATEHSFPAELVLACIARHVQERPDALAVESHHCAITYRQLDAIADQLAGQLCEQGLARGHVAAVMVDRSVAYVAALLAVMKTGAAYLPIDPAYPMERIRYMIEDSGARLMLWQQELPGLLPEGVSAINISQDALLKTDAASNDAKKKNAPSLAPGDTAYIIYTSGSTGRPKGVAISQAALANLVYWHGDAFSLGPHDRTTLIAGVGFDASVWEIWPTLAHGASLHVVDENVRLGGLALRDWLIDTRITVSFIPTPITEELLRLPWPAANAPRMLLTGGDRLHHYPPAGLPFRVVNNYGPTEGAVVSTSIFLEENGVGEPPIGRPIANAKTYVFGPHRELVPSGIWGELWIGGAHLAQGYWRHPELTDDRFIELQGFGRLYRTGDRVRWNREGQLEFGGRVDRQVKLRGYRIELGEIEQALCEEPGVRDAVVEVRGSGTADGRLIGYAVVDRDACRAEGEESHVDAWAQLYEDTYAESSGGDLALNITGWRSSYTGDIIDASEMREWVEGTVARIRALHARRILEIGFGTGMLLLRIAPDTERYEGWDFSQRALDYVRNAAAQLGGMDHVVLHRKTADEASSLDAAAFEAVVLNSVIQYFPGVEYLRHVLDGALHALTEGGSLFIGDVRSLSLLPAYAASVEAFRAESGITRSALRDRVERRIREEEELAVDPAFFLAWAASHPRVRGVRISPKRGKAGNELTRFRYDVTISTANVPAGAVWLDDMDWHDWSSLENGVRTLEAMLARGEASVALRAVPNARLSHETALMRWLAVQDDDSAKRPAEMVLSDGLDPEAVWALAEKYGYDACVDTSEGHPEGHMRVAFFARTAEAISGEAGWLRPVSMDCDWRTFTTDPLQGWYARHWTPRVRERLKSRLPEYMIPVHLVVMDALPLTAHGKVDRRALPDPEQGRTVWAGVYQAPETEVERQLAVLWQELLGVARVGRTDQFFELGGHSLLATQLVSRVREMFNAEITLRAFFEQPTLQGLAETIERARGTAALPLERIPRDGRPLPLSFAQQRLWFFEQFVPGTPAYNMPAAFRVKGLLNRAALERALTEIIRRHEPLRTTFTQEGGEASQTILEPAEFTLDIRDLRAESAEMREARVREILTAENARPFDLAKGPLFRAVLIALDDETHIIQFVMHHIISDGWSMGVFLRELAACYEAFSTDRAVALPELPIQYADFAAGQRAWLQGEVLRKQASYWKSQLAGVAPLALPTDYPRPPVQAFDGAARVLLLPKPLLDALRAAGQRENATLFMTLLAAMDVLLWRYAGNRDIAVGTPIANRNRAEVEPLIGFFVNTLVMRTQLDGALTFFELIRRVKDTALGAYEHQDLPFEQVVEEVNPPRDTSRNPLFQIMFAVQNAKLSWSDFPGLELRPLESPVKSTRFDLEFHFWEMESASGMPAEGLACSIIYATSLFKDVTIARFETHLRTLLESIAANPGASITDLAWTPLDEQERVTRTWNQTARPYPDHACIHTLFEAQVAQTPNAPALVQNGETWTYAELNARANRLAHQLASLGAGPETPVALLLERGRDQIVATLAALKAGGAYLPISPDYPPSRIHYLLEDAGAVCVVSRQAFEPLLGENTAPRLWIDRDAARINALPADNLPCSVSAENLAYLMYTSGSTGLPKGVCVTHRNVVRLVCGADYIPFNAGQVFLHFAPPTFDAATLEIWGSLLHGAKLVIFPGELTGLSSLGDVITRERVTTLWLTAGLFHQMVESGLSSLAGVQNLLAGGDIVSPAHVRRALEAIPGLRFVNGYGPTECTTFTCCGPLTAADDIGASVPIGRPIANTRVYVLDADMRPVGVGVPGELFIGGDGVARGYLNAPELTAQRFLPDPYSSDPAARLYRTGDCVRWLEDGRLEFLGRLDRQVKIRGFRIELGEVEAALAEHPGVLQAAVIARTWGGLDARLAAYVVPRSGVELASAELRRHLSDRLPGYMLPAAFILMEALPLTANGKLDRDALPEPDTQRGDASAPYEAPRDDVEETIASIWREVLGIERIGIWDNFLDSGGHSLLAIKMLARVNAVCKTEVSLREVFEQPTIAGLADAVRRAQRGEAPPVSTIPAATSPLLVPLRTEGRKRPLFCIAPAGGTAYPYYGLAHHLGKDQPVYALQDPSFAEDRPPCATIEEMAACYLAAIREVQPHGPYQLVGWSYGGIVAFEMARQLEQAGESTEFIGVIEAFIPSRVKMPFAKSFRMMFSAGSTFLALTRSWLEIARDSKYLEINARRREGDPAHVEKKSWRARFRAKIDDIAWKKFLQTADMARITSEEERFLLIRQPATGRFFKIAKDNMKAFQRYAFPPASCKVVLFRAERHAKRKFFETPTLGWERIAQGGVEMHMIPGDHFSIIRNPSVGIMAQIIRAMLDGEKVSSHTGNLPK